MTVRERDMVAVERGGGGGGGGRWGWWVVRREGGVWWEIGGWRMGREVVRRRLCFSVFKGAGRGPA